MTGLTTARLTDKELADLKAQISMEEQRRLRLERIPEQIKELNRQLIYDLGRGDGQRWIKPDGWWDSYPEGWLVQDFTGVQFRSKVEGNTFDLDDGASWQVWEEDLED